MITGKQPISVTLSADNVTWLKSRVAAIGRRSVSELLDQLISDARQAGHSGSARSIVGTVDIDPSDPLLESADNAVQALFRLEKAAKKRRG